MTVFNSCIKAFPNSEEQNKALKAFMVALKIKYEETSQVNEPESEYSPEIIEKVKRGEQEIKEGKGVSMTIEDLRNRWK